MPELAALGGERRRCWRMAATCVAKGGHAEGDLDHRPAARRPSGEIAAGNAKRIDTDDTHGTGCTFASALACGLGSGMRIADAFGRRVRFVRIAILAAPGLGQGHGPMGQQLASCRSTRSRADARPEARKALPRAGRRGGRSRARAARRAGRRRRGDPAGKGVPRGIDDSKKLSAAERARLHGRLRGCAIVGIGIVEADEIDRLNIYWATMKAMTLGGRGARRCAPGHVLVDGNRLPRWSTPRPRSSAATRISLSIAAASIVAKHTRDTIMLAHAEAYPQYGWHSNKGYGCPAHLRALREHGPSPLHRRSFAPVAQAYLANL